MTPAELLLPDIQLRSFRGVKHGVSSRLGGVSEGPYSSLNLGLRTPDDEQSVLANRSRFFDALCASADSVVTGNLTHGNEVSVFRQGQSDQWPLARRPGRPGSDTKIPVFDSDAAIGNVPGLTFMVTAADCVPLLFLDRKRGVVSLAHAGWRGTAAGIAVEVVRAMRAEFGSDPADIIAGIGPSIGPCCYTVGEEVLASFAAHGQDPVFAAGNGDLKLDLWSSNERQLEAEGVPLESIENLHLCTSCRTDIFYSHRRENGTTGRFAACIGLA